MQDVMPCFDHPEICVYNEVNGNTTAGLVNQLYTTLRMTMQCSHRNGFGIICA